MWMFWKVRREGEMSFQDNSGTLGCRKEAVWPQNSSQALDLSSECSGL